MQEPQRYDKVTTIREGRGVHDEAGVALHDLVSISHRIDESVYIVIVTVFSNPLCT